MKEPLTQSPSVAHRQVEEELPVPPRRTAPAAEAAEQPAPRAQQPAPSPRYDAPRYDDEDMPRPAYQPEPRQAAAPSQADMLNGDASGFMAPTRRAPQAPAGTPSDAVMQRLASAVARAPERQAAAAQARQPQPQPAPEAPRGNPGRMGGLSRMLERISGHADQPAEKPAAATIAERVNERVAARSRGGFDAGFDDLASPDRADDNVEIPAFLRRQAN